MYPSSGEVRSDSPEEIACWFIDTDSNEGSFYLPAENLRLWLDSGVPKLSG